MPLITGDISNAVKCSAQLLEVSVFMAMDDKPLPAAAGRQIRALCGFGETI
jgi:hypothetical protein